MKFLLCKIYSVDNQKRVANVGRFWKLKKTWDLISDTSGNSGGETFVC
ncbi:hypothetical protein [Mesotoga sp. BH458_6_3_2_1]|nr:hypothetical protein [Mesotoga sp. BH458_6_3_2_1]